jgi:hypothetical protein
VTTRETVTGKIDIKIGTVSFSAEGEQEWLSKQLNTVIDAVTKSGGSLTGDGAEKASFNEDTASDSINENHSPSLASYLKDKNADRNQLVRFLATACWLRRRGRKDISTSDVSKMLSEHHQKRLANPSDCLNKNVAKGFCEKKGKLFFVTPEGLRTLGDDNGAS